MAAANLKKSVGGGGAGGSLRSWFVWRPAVLGICAMILLSASAGIISGYMTLGRGTVFNRAGQDFGIIYRSVRQHGAGRSLYDLDETGEDLWWGRNLNLPHANVALLPLTALAPSAALPVWLALSVLALADTGRRTIRGTDARLGWFGALALFVYLLAWAPTAAMVLTLQVSLLVMWVVALAWLHARRGEWASAGLWLGLAGSVKPFLLVSLPYLAIRRQWTALGCALAAVGGMVALGIAVFGLESYREWLRQAGEITWTAHYMNASITGVLERWIGRSSGYAPLFRAPGLVAPLGIAASGLVGLFTLRRIARDGQSSEVIDSEWVAWLLASLLMSPLGWIYYFWLALPPLVVVSVRSAPWARRRTSDLMWLFGVVGLLWFASMTVWGQPRWWATLTLGSMYFWALMALWLWTLREVPVGPSGAARGASEAGR